MTTLVHVDLQVRDMQRSIKFYTEQLGYAVVEDAVVENGPAEFYAPGAKSMRLVFLRPLSRALFGSMVELMEFRSQDGRILPPAGANDGARSSASMRNLSFLVDSLDSTLAQLAAAGIKPLSDIYTVELPRLGRSRIVFIHDPDANLIELIESRAAGPGSIS